MDDIKQFLDEFDKQVTITNTAVLLNLCRVLHDCAEDIAMESMYNHDKDGGLSYFLLERESHWLESPHGSREFLANCLVNRIKKARRYLGEAQQILRNRIHE